MFDKVVSSFSSNVSKYGDEIANNLKSKIIPTPNTSGQTNAGPNSNEITDFGRIITTIADTNWTLTDDFSFIFINKLIPISNIDVTGVQSQDVITSSVVSVDVPEMTSPESDAVVGGERRMNVRMPELFRFSLKFRDRDALKLRRYFEKIWMAQQYEYFDDIKSSVDILNKNVLLFRTADAMITGISAISFDNNTTAIAEFDLQMVCRTYSDIDVKLFGNSKTVDKFVEPEEQKDPDINGVGDGAGWGY